MTRPLPVILGLLLLAGQASATERYQYTYCYTVEYQGAGDRFLFSAPFPAPPEALPGESTDQADTRQRALYAQASQEFYRFLQSTVGDQHQQPDCQQIGAFLPGHADSADGAIERARATMRSISSNKPADVALYTDFVPSWAGVMTAGREPTPEPEAGTGILLDDGPTPAEDAAARQASAEDAQAQAEAQRQHAQTLQLRFDAQMAQEGAEIRRRAEAIRADYDRRQAACMAGDAANCYAKAGAQ